MSQPPGALVIDGRDPRQVEYAALLYNVVADLVRKGLTTQSIHVLDLANPVMETARRLSPHIDIKVAPPFLVIHNPTRRILSGPELDAFAATVTRLNQPQPPPAPAPTQVHAHAQPSHPAAAPQKRVAVSAAPDPASIKMSVQPTEAAEEAVHKPPPPPMPEGLKMSAQTQGASKRPVQEKSVDVDGYASKPAKQAVDDDEQ